MKVDVDNKEQQRGENFWWEKCDEERNFIMPHQIESIQAMIHSTKKNILYI